MNKEQIGLRIKLERTKQNLTQEQLAEMADISSSYLSAIERGKQSISLGLYQQDCRGIENSGH